MILAHSGHDLLGFGMDGLSSEDAPQTTARRIAPQLLDWIRQEGARP
jgi:hypothetical protein